MAAEPTTTPTEGPPAEAERFVVTSKAIKVSANRLADLGEDVLEEYGIELPPEPDNRWTAWAVDVEAGEELPPELGRELYDAFGDRIAIYDADGERLDEPRDGDEGDQQLHAGPEFPPGAKRFEVRRNELVLSPGKVRDLPDETLEAYGLEPDDRGRVIIEAGEAIPPDVVATVYQAFHDKIAAFDADGNRVA